VGAGETGLEAAVLFSRLGTRVVLIDRQKLPWSEFETGRGAILRQLQRLGVRFLADSEVIAAARAPIGATQLELMSGERLSAESALFTIERRGLTDGLGLEEIGIQLDERGRLWCDSQQRSWLPNILAIGDVVGHPRIASEGVDAPRRAVWQVLNRESARVVASGASSLASAPTWRLTPR
jgi:NAD(P) transhydrogenase